MITLTSTTLAKFKMLAAADQTPFLTDDECTALLTDWAVADEGGNAPDGAWMLFDWDGALEQAWMLKAARAGILVDTQADQEKASLSQIRQSCIEQAALYRNRRNGTLGPMR